MAITYGLTPSGPVRKPAGAIFNSLATGSKGLPGFGGLRIETGSTAGNWIQGFTNELSQAWEAWEASTQAFDKDKAEDQSLDALFTLVGKSRQLAQYSSAPLTLWGLAATLTMVPAGNQAQQSDTGVIFETLDDAEIPAATVAIDGLLIGEIEYIGPDTRYHVADMTDLSLVTAGMLFICQGAFNIANDGAFLITNVSDVGDYLDVANPKRSDNAADELDSPGTCIITNAFVTVASQSLDKGEFPSPAQSIDTIVTPIADWQGVVNLVGGITGRNTENNTDFRVRVPTELTNAQGSTVEALKAQLRKVPGVTYVAGFSVDDPDDPDYGYAFTVVGGTNQAIVNVLGEFKAGGVPTKGTEFATYTDPEGLSETMYFNRVDEINPYVTANLTVNGNYPANGDALVEAALLAYNDQIQHGDDLLNHELVGAIVAAQIPGITRIQVYQGLSASPSSDANIAILPTEVAVLVAPRIVVNS